MRSTPSPTRSATRLRRADHRDRPHAARSADGAFAGDVGDAEPPALAAAALADQLAVEPDEDLSTLIALLIGSATWTGAAPAIAGMRLPGVRDTTARTPRGDDALHRAAVRRALARRGGSRARSPSSRSTASGGGRAGHTRALEEIAARIDEIAARADARAHRAARAASDPDLGTRVVVRDRGGRLARRARGGAPADRRRRARAACRGHRAGDRSARR